ncbi:hypothetical protein EGW08_015090 [Elysia chlorotica]|uniref:SCAN box domain-containing protein n=1 Tax=Elysia chlorotica TaxID=188477 RepID=A0A433T6E7_ELYCH|nr:hypothetical protein EGW08_015090 [Elysia chlorotica]
MSEVATRLAAEADAMELRGREKKLYIKEGLEKEQEREEKRRQQLQELQEKRRQEEIAEKRRQEEIEKRRSRGNDQVQRQTPEITVIVDCKDDLDSWLLRFERFAETSQWQKESWPAYLSELLTGRALDCFCHLSTEDAKNYDAIKLALQKRYNLTEDGYRSMFRQCKPEEGENPGMFVVWLKIYLERWVTLSETEQTYDSLRDLFVREQFMDASPTDLSIHLREKRLRSHDELAREADAYLVARNRQMCKSKSSTQGNNGPAKSNGALIVILELRCVTGSCS